MLLLSVDMDLAGRAPRLSVSIVLILAHLGSSQSSRSTGEFTIPKEVGWPSTRTFDRQPCHLPTSISHSPELATACVDVRGTIYSIDSLINHPRTDTTATLAWPEHTKFPSLPIQTAYPPKIHRCLRPLCVCLPISLQNRFSPSGGDRGWMGSRRS